MLMKDTQDVSDVLYRKVASFVQELIDHLHRYTLAQIINIYQFCNYRETQDKISYRSTSNDLL